MDYQPAALTTEQIARIRQVEEELSANTDHPIILIAYDGEEEASASKHN